MPSPPLPPTAAAPAPAAVHPTSSSFIHPDHQSVSISYACPGPDDNTNEIRLHHELLRSDTRSTRYSIRFGPTSPLSDASWSMNTIHPDPGNLTRQHQREHPQGNQANSSEGGHHQLPVSVLLVQTLCLPPLPYLHIISRDKDTSSFACYLSARVFLFYAAYPFSDFSSKGGCSTKESGSLATIPSSSCLPLNPSPHLNLTPTLTSTIILSLISFQPSTFTFELNAWPDTQERVSFSSPVQRSASSVCTYLRIRDITASSRRGMT